jgi:processive 1,2-diacylglycerol beta-glucosyltransferase
MTDKKKVMIVYSTAGMGHKKAALALKSCFEISAPGCQIEIVDIMEYATPLYKFLYLDFYVFLMQRASWFWGFMYYASNSRVVDVLTRKLRGTLDWMGVPGFGDMLSRKAPDAIVATHFIIPSIAWILKDRKGLISKLFAVITDYGPHTYWLSDSIDLFFAGCPSVESELIKRGVPEEKIRVSGIPTTEEFHKAHGIEALKKRYGLDGNKKTVFIMSGGFGVGPVGKMLIEMQKCRTKIEIIAVCGHNKDLYRDLEKLSRQLNYTVKLFGFTDKVAELMAVSDLMITKAGGISVTEAMDSRLPMILYGSIPGQETWNERFLTSNGAARIAGKIEDIPGLADGILGSEEVYSSFKQGLDAIRRPDAAEDITKEVLTAIGGRHG